MNELLLPNETDGQTINNTVVQRDSQSIHDGKESNLKELNRCITKIKKYSA